MSSFGMGGFGDMRGGGQGLGVLEAALSAARGFEEQYHCYPVSFQASTDVIIDSQATHLGEGRSLS